MSLALIAQLFFYTFHSLFMNSFWCLDLKDNCLAQDCFVLKETTRLSHFDEVIECKFAQAGQFPSQTQRLQNGRCCFKAQEGHAVFWAIGESSISSQINLEIPSKADEHVKLCKKRFYKFEVEPAILAEFLVLDAQTDEGIRARIRMADQSIHLLAFTKVSDNDGFVVLPMQAGKNYVLNVRAQGYLNASALSITPKAPIDGVPVAEVIELDPGLKLSGRVIDQARRPVANAKIRVLIKAGDSLWDNEIDRPKGISELIDSESDMALGLRHRLTSDAEGRFVIESIPRGELSLYAYDEKRGPEHLIRANLSDADVLDDLELSISEGVNLWLRLNSAIQRRVVLQVIDKTTGHHFTPLQSETNSSLRLFHMPKNARFIIEGEGLVKYDSAHELSHDAEVKIELLAAQEIQIRGKIIDAQTGRPIAEAKVLALASELSHCRSKTDSNGNYVIDNCTNSRFWALASAPNYASHIFFLDSQTPQTLELNRGASLEVFIDKAWSEVGQAQCKFSTAYPSLHDETYIHKTAFGLNAETSKLNFRPALTQSLTCDFKGYETLVASISPKIGEELRLDFKLRPLQTIEGIVLDAQSAPVPQALIVIGNERFESDAYGRFEHIRSSHQEEDGVAYHWLYGRGRFKIGAEKTSKTFEIRLDEDISNECLEQLKLLGIDYLHENGSLQIETMPRSDQSSGLQRGDYVEDCSRDGFQIVRKNQRIFL